MRAFPFRWLAGFVPGALLLPLAQAEPVKICAESWPPFLFRNSNGDVTGMAAQWITRAAQQAGLQPSFQFLSLPSCRRLAAAGMVDALAFTPSKEQLEGWLLTREPMVFWVLTAFVPYQSPHRAFQDLAQFSGQRVGWGQFYRYPDRLALKRDWERVKAFDAEAVFTLLVRGRVNVVFDDERFVDHALPQNIRMQLRALHPAAAAMAQPVVVRPGLGVFAQALDREARDLRRQGVLDRFYRQHYHTPLDTLLATAD